MIEENAGKGFGEVVGHIDRGVNATKHQKITFYPLLDGIKFDINMPCAWHWFAGICHSRCTIIVSYRIVAASCCKPKSHRML
jgi:hypothetical protein